MNDPFSTTGGAPPPPPPPPPAGQPFSQGGFDPSWGGQQGQQWQQGQQGQQQSGGQPMGGDQQGFQQGGMNPGMDPAAMGGDMMSMDPSMGGMDPSMGQGMTGQHPTAQGSTQGIGQDLVGQTPTPPVPSKPANFQLGAKLPSGLKISVPQHSLQFDEQYFLHLLAGSISLTKDEKMRIVESIPKLKQTQVDELIRIFEEERHKFAELGEEHLPQLEKLAQQHYEDWVDIEMKQEQTSKADEDAKKAEEIRKQLGL